MAGNSMITTAFFSCNFIFLGILCARQSLPFCHRLPPHSIYFLVRTRLLLGLGRGTKTEDSKATGGRSVCVSVRGSLSNKMS
jgi:hypothetical protein